jgi:serine/threonine-protein phosphatase 2A activator
MLKMYKAEVLGKLPVAQHFLFGSFLPYTGPPSPAAAWGDHGPEDAHGHSHAHDRGSAEAGWGDCCGIPVPSAFAAAQAERKGPRAFEGPGIRPVPFD